MKAKLIFAMALFAGLTVLTSVSRADVLGPNNCGSCFGDAYLLQFDPNNTTTSGGLTIYDVFLSISTAGYNGTGNFINSVAVKIASSVDASSTLVAAPGGTGAWTLQTGGLNANGCDGSGAGFLCAQDSTHAPVPGGIYTWEFHYATSSALLTGSLNSSVKALYVDSTGKQAGITSEGITLQACTTGTDCGGGGFPQGNVPEPTSIALLGGVVVFAIRGIRRKLA